jgi:hypothetical protein
MMTVNGKSLTEQSATREGEMSERKTIFSRKKDLRILCIALIVAIVMLPVVLDAGDLDPSVSYGPPSDAASAMYTLEDIYNRLNAGTEGTKRSGGFADPTSVGSTMYTLDQIMGVAPPFAAVASDTARADVDEVCNGLWYWGLHTSSWGMQTGTKDCNAPSFTSSAVTAVNEDASYNYTITADDTEGAPGLTITALARPAWLSITSVGGGSEDLTGTPDNDDVGDHPVALLVTDGGGLTATQSFTVTVSNQNDDPVATDDARSVTASTSATVNVLADDTDVDGDILSLSSFTQPGAGNGSVARDDNGTPADQTDDMLVYTAPAGSGSYSFTYTVSDGNGGTDIGDVDITVP